MARSTDIKPYSIEFESFVTGHHVYKAVWSPFIGESLNTQMELDNVHDKYVVKVSKNPAVVGHVPREISRYCSFVLNSGGTMDATVTGAREIRRGNGMIPCKYKLKGPNTLVYKPTGPIPGYKPMGL